MVPPLERIRLAQQGHNARLAKISAGEVAYPLTAVHRCVLDVVPASAIDEVHRKQLIQTANQHRDKLRPLTASAWDHRPNAEGFLTYFPVPEAPEQTHAYLQMLRDGTIETVCDRMVFSNGKQLILNGAYVEEHLVDAVTGYLNALDQIVGSRSATVLITFQGVMGARIYIEAEGRRGAHAIDRDVLQLPPVLVDGSENVPGALREPFDFLWQAAGFHGSPHYSDAGEWRRPR